MRTQLEKFYTSGEFAKKANVSIRTIRYYDKQNLLKPADISDAGYRLYTDADFAKLQKILSLKYLGFSLEEIRSITVGDEDDNYIKESLALQQRLLKKKIEHLHLVEQTLQETMELVKEDDVVEWDKILRLIHITNMEKSLVEQYKNAANIDIRIELHKRFSQNHQTWFSWIYQQLQLESGEEVLELGCGNGQLWLESASIIPQNMTLCLTDISEGVISDVKQKVAPLQQNHINFEVMDCCTIQKENAIYDKVIANHVLFYVKNLDQALNGIVSVLKATGMFFCTTYGKNHMKEISQLVKEFDSRITLSDIQLYDIFGLENGKQALEQYFDQVEEVLYEDSLEVDEVGPLMEYILSCHGNQQEYLSNRYEEFRSFLERKIQKKGTITITKQAGGFICHKGGNLR